MISLINHSSQSSASRCSGFGEPLEKDSVSESANFSRYLVIVIPWIDECRPASAAASRRVEGWRAGFIVKEGRRRLRYFAMTLFEFSPVSRRLRISGDRLAPPLISLFRSSSARYPASRVSSASRKSRNVDGNVEGWIVAKDGFILAGVWRNRWQVARLRYWDIEICPPWHFSNFLYWSSRVSFIRPGRIPRRAECRVWCRTVISLIDRAILGLREHSRAGARMRSIPLRDSTAAKCIKSSRPLLICDVWASRGHAASTGGASQVEDDRDRVIERDESGAVTSRETLRYCEISRHDLETFGANSR